LTLEEEGSALLQQVACIGGGLIGHSWATVFAWHGCSVRLYRRGEATLAPTLNRIESNLEFLAEHGLLDTQQASAALQRISATTDLEEALAGCEYVQESILEQLPLKVELFNRLDALAPPSVILASSTSTLAMTNIARQTAHPDRCIVAHPWNPPHLVPLVELIPGERTSAATVETTREFMEDLGKVPVVQKKEAIGAVGNRLTAALWREAIHIVLEGIADPGEVDKAITAGPGFRLAAVGTFLTYHLGGGEGGITSYMEHLGPTMADRWESLGALTSLSEDEKERVVSLVEGMELVQDSPMGELAQWRDRRLAALLKVRDLTPGGWEP
jgi:3-hydroxypropionate dehydrogenase (NADP+)